MKLKALFLICIILSSLLFGCSSDQPAQIAATTLPVYQFTSRLCEGTGITVARLVTQSVSCLHDYSLNVSQVKTAETADVIVISGAGLESFMDDLLEDTDTIIDSSKDIDLLDCETEHEHDHSHDHHQEEDSHIWLSPFNAKIMASNICDGLSAQFPQHQKAFAENLTVLLSDLDQLQAYGEAQLQDLDCRELITFHDGFAYLAHAFDLRILEAIEEESGSEASAQELIDLIGLVQTHKLPAIFTEINGSVSAADIISAETGAKAYSLDMAMAGVDYFAAMYRNIDTIREALG